jgi:hypothetical protein
MAFCGRLAIGPLGPIHCPPERVANPQQVDNLPHCPASAAGTGYAEHALWGRMAFCGRLAIGPLGPIHCPPERVANPQQVDNLPHCPAFAAGTGYAEHALWGRMAFCGRLAIGPLGPIHGPPERVPGICRRI